MHPDRGCCSQMQPRSTFTYDCRDQSPVQCVSARNLPLVRAGVLQPATAKHNYVRPRQHALNRSRHSPRRPVRPQDRARHRQVRPLPGLRGPLLVGHLARSPCIRTGMACRPASRAVAPPCPLLSVSPITSPRLPTHRPSSTICRASTRAAPAPTHSNSSDRTKIETYCHQPWALPPYCYVRAWINHGLRAVMLTPVSSEILCFDMIVSIQQPSCKPSSLRTPHNKAVAPPRKVSIAR